MMSLGPPELSETLSQKHKMLSKNSRSHAVGYCHVHPSPHSAEEEVWTVGVRVTHFFCYVTSLCYCTEAFHAGKVQYSGASASGLSSGNSS